MKKLLLPLCFGVFLLLNLNSYAQEKDFFDLGWELVQTETLGKLKFGLPLKKVIEILGKPEEMSEMVEWAADAEYHQTYTYKKQGVELDIIGEKDPERKINIIIITPPCKYKTKKGIGIGSSYTEVEKAYKGYIEPSFSGENGITAGTIYGGILFGFEDGKVNVIFIGAAAD